jgi:hypothetical protein
MDVVLFADVGGDHGFNEIKFVLNLGLRLLNGVPALVITRLKSAI